MSSIVIVIGLALSARFNLKLRKYAPNIIVAGEIIRKNLRL